MHAPRPTKPEWQNKLTRSAYFFAAVLLHLVIFALVGTFVIWKASEPPAAEFLAVSPKTIPPPPPLPPPASGAAAANPQFEPQQVTVPTVAPPNIITANNEAFHVDATKVVQALSHVSIQQAQGTGLAAGSGDTGSGSGNGFGSSNGAGNQFKGYFYDFKQNADRVTTRMTEARWRWIMSQYIAKNWDESMLHDFFRGRAPMYTSAFAISTRMSEEAPKAFGLAADVKPAMWAIHYHAKVSAPEGDYRFVGFGDDVLEVRVNGTFVLDAGWISLSGNNDLHESLPTQWSPQYSKLENDKDRLPGMGPTNGLMKRGAQFHMNQGEAVDMDVLIGDQGGKCAFYLQVEKVGEAYTKQADGTPTLPFFEIGSTQAPTFGGGEEHPPFSSTAAPWQGVDDNQP